MSLGSGTRIAGTGPRIALVVKGYPRLSETFISQEMLALQETGIAFEIWALRRPTDKAVHALNRAITAPVCYLPEYLHQEPLRVLKGLVGAIGRPALGRLLRVFWKDLLRDPTPNRLRRLGQAMTMARELDPAIGHIHVHYLHTPASVVRYACLLSGRSFSFSAHAKDIWTTPDWDKREKIADCRFGVTCTQAGLAVLRALSPVADGDRVALVYHGLDLSRFPAPPDRTGAPDATDAGRPVTVLSVGRLVGKKGYGDLLTALAALPAGLHWRFVHIGSGQLKDALARQAAALGLADRITWRGGLAQDDVIAAMREADVFVLPCKEGENGDRDGLPNVLMEAATQGLALLSTRFAGVPEFITADVNGLLVPPGDPAALAAALERLAGDPALRAQLGRAARQRVASAFSFQAGIATLVERLQGCMASPRGVIERNRETTAWVAR
jgi:glycosyltransferase involved in cell wall biosynthesis